MELELFINREGTLYFPAVVESVTLDLERRDAPGKLTFQVVDDGKLKAEEGNPVMVRVDGKDFFYGFLFTMRRDKDQLIQMTAYDQLRYLKNKDTYVYENKKASEVVQMLAADFNLQTGEIADTGFIIPSRVEDGKTLFDIINSALDLTLDHTGRLFVLYDDCGRITLKDIADMKTNLLIDGETAQNFDYSTSIDSGTYNKIKLLYENQDTGKRDIYLTMHQENMNKWGVLQFHEKIQSPESGQKIADTLLTLYNRVTKTLSIKDAFGDTRVRAGSSLPVMLDLGGEKISNYMVAEKVRHKFENSLHTMDLTLRGAGFDA